MEKIKTLIKDFKDENLTTGFTKTPEELYGLFSKKLDAENINGEIQILSQNAEKSILIGNKHLLVLRSKQKYCPVQEVPILIKLAQLQIKSATILKFDEKNITEKQVNI